MIKENLERAAKWLSRKSQQCHARSLDTKARLESTGKALDLLWEQWHLQVETQTQPLPSMWDWQVWLTYWYQPKNKGKKAIEEAKWLRLARDTICTRVQQLQKIISDIHSLDHEVVIAQSDLQKEEVQLAKADEQVGAKERLFGANERSQLDRLLKNKYAEMVINARALKIRICQWLISRKFEWDRIEWSLWGHTTGNATWWHDHIQVNFS